MTLIDVMSSDIKKVFLTDLAEDAVFTSIEDWQTASIKVIFVDEYQSLDLFNTGVGVEARNPFVFCDASDVPNAKAGDMLVIRGKTYKVRLVQDGSTGITILELSED